MSPLPVLFQSQGHRRLVHVAIYPPTLAAPRWGLVSTFTRPVDVERTLLRDGIKFAGQLIFWFWGPTEIPDGRDEPSQRACGAALACEFVVPRK
jgi:hypothetical protein